MRNKAWHLLVLLCVYTVLQLHEDAHAQSVKLYAPNSDGKIRALVIGIDKYKNPDYIPPLDGAVADAKDFADVYRKAGVQDLTMILDEQANRSNIIAALKKLAGSAQKNDLVIISYAGHGSQQNEYGKSFEPDRKDEIFVLWGYGSRGNDVDQYLLDDDVFFWLKRIAATGAEVIFLADSCHGGGMSKAVDPRAKLLPVRGLEQVDHPDLAGPGKIYIPEKLKTRSIKTRSVNDDLATKEVPNLTFIAGVEADQLVPEVYIAGEETPRGATSYAMAQALQGHADQDRNGVTTRKELIRYLRRQVQVLSRSRQAPVLEPLDNGGERPLFASLPFKSIDLTEPPQNKPAINKPKSPNVSAKKTSENALTRFFRLVTQYRSSGVRFYSRTGDVINEDDGTVLVYRSSSNAREHAIRSIAAYQVIADLIKHQVAPIAISPSSKVYNVGESFKIEIQETAGRNLILLNMTGDGKIQYLFPGDGRDPYIVDPKFALSLKAAPPFGSDTMIAILTKKRRPRLELELKLLHEKHAAQRLVEIMSIFLGKNDKVGLVTYTTRPR